MIEKTGQAAPEFPFCSQRCRLIDLGRWFNGDYVISRTLAEDDLISDTAE